MKTLIKILCLSVLWFSCEENQNIHGCFDSQACNYNPNANIDNNSCIYLEDKIEQGFCSCDEEVYDECDVCGGDGVDFDQDGICDDADDCIGIDYCGNCQGEELEYINLWNECYNIETTTVLHIDGDVSVSGEISSEIGQLINLKDLKISGCLLEGSIPNEIGNLINLEYLKFDNCQLTGNVPSELNNLTNLTYLNLSSNQFEGTIFDKILNNTNLEELHLHQNQFIGEIPYEIENLINLYKVSIYGNEFGGTIFDKILNNTNLEELRMSNNNFNGDISYEIENLTNLTTLSSFNNQLTGEIPPEIGNLTNLTYLGLGYNQLSGEIPEEMCNVNSVYLENNKLCPPYPECIHESYIGEQDTSNCP